MDLFVEGLQGSGKSTLVSRLEELYPDHRAVREGEYSPVELAWCAYLNEKEYLKILDRYGEIKREIEAKTFREGSRRIVCYTKIVTDLPGFYEELGGYEIYNGRIAYDDFEKIVLGRYRMRGPDRNIFECSLFQNTVEDMILFRDMPDDRIAGFYERVREALEGRDYHIFYLETEDVKGNLDVIRRERTDEKGNELWFPMMMGYFNGSPYAVRRGLKGENALIAHLEHRQALELRLCREIFPDKTAVLRSKAYGNEDLRRTKEKQTWTSLWSPSAGS